MSAQSIIDQARSALGDFVSIESYQYASCYRWYECLLFNRFGEQIQALGGNTTYLYLHNNVPMEDFFHELGHLVSRKFDVVGHAENGYCGSWGRSAKSLIGRVSMHRHWSEYLNLYARQDNCFRWNAASEVWAEPFTLWYLWPDADENYLIKHEIKRLGVFPVFNAVAGLAESLVSQANHRCGPAENVSTV